MSTQQRTPSHKWNEDGDTISGTLTGLRWGKQKEEYGGGQLPVICLQTEFGDREVWLNGRLNDYGDPTGLWGNVHGQSPRFGDVITIQRGGLVDFTTKQGDKRQYREWNVIVQRTPGAFADLRSGPGLPDPQQAPQPAPVHPTSDDSDIPF